MRGKMRHLILVLYNLIQFWLYLMQMDIFKTLLVLLREAELEIDL